MKTQSRLGIICIIIVAVGLAPVGPLAVADTGNSARKWYVNGDAGVCLQQNVDSITSTFNGGTPSTNPGIEFDPGVRVDLSIGYNLTKNWAIELESGFCYNEISKFASVIDLGYELYQVPLLLNGIYKYSFSHKWQGYGGVGLGGVASILDASSRGFGRDTDFLFGYQAELGVEYHFSANWGCGLEYKFLGTLDHDWTFEWNGNNQRIQSDPTMSHSILLSLTYEF